MGTSTESKHFLTNTAKRIINKPINERTPISLEDIRAAQSHVADLAIRTPLVRLNVDNAPAEIYLKLENLQPINSFKIRGAGNAMRLADPEQLAQGVWTASAGNMAQGVAWCARQLGYRCRVVVPDHAPQAKLDAMVRLGAEYVDETAKALRLIAERNRVIAEGAGAVSAAVALSGQAGAGKVVCVVSGGNIDTGKLTTILQGNVP